MKTTFLILGSNLGNRLDYIEKSLEQINQQIGTIVKKSSIYTTAPWGFKCENDFLNLVVKIDTHLTAQEILEKCLFIEKQLGRERKQTNTYSSRTIDIDILFYENEIINNEKLTIPHPRLTERNFVLKPLCEIYPDGIHPILNQRITDLYKSCNDTQDAFIIDQKTYSF